MDPAELVVPLATLSVLLIGVSAFLLYAKRRQATTPQPRQSLDEPQDVVNVLFATQTGTAEKFAKQLVTKLSEHYGEGVTFRAKDIETYDYEAKLQHERMVVILVATYGDGEPTDNCVEFHKWLGEHADAAFDGNAPELLADIPYAVFGLGNKTYEHFNAMGKFVHKHLGRLGGVPIVSVGLGNDDCDIADDFDLWMADLFKAIDAKALLHQSSAARTSAPQTKQGYAVELHAVGTLTNGSLSRVPEAWVGATEKHMPQMVTIATSRELHGSKSERSCIHAEVDLAGTGFSYEHGDHIALYPRNSDGTVQAACAALRWDQDTTFSLAIPPGNPEMLAEPFACPTTVHMALQHHCELLQHPDKAALQLLASCAADESEAQRLRHLAGHDGKAEFAEYIVASERSLIEVLQDFTSVEVPMGLFFAHIAPPLRPRYYSISSSPLQHKACTHVTAAVIDHPTSTGRQHLGVATSMLARLPPGSQLPAFVRNSSFRLPPDASKPVIMVGPGTGLAPFRGFLQHRRALRAKGVHLGTAMLFFGCRDPAKDFIYQDELEAALADGVITSLHVAFSRVSSHKEYVQHKMLEHRCDIFAALQGGGSLYVCGDAKHMARDVHKAMLEVATGCNGVDNAGAEEWVAQLQRDGRYLQDVW